MIRTRQIANIQIRMLAFLVFMAGMAVLGCRTSPNEPADGTSDLAAPQFDAATRDYGICWGSRTRPSCIIDGHCRPPFETCQHGTCCSGVLDPKTCTCSCNGGEECTAGSVCCPGDKSHPNVPKLGVWMCRDPEGDCSCNLEPGVQCSEYPDLRMR